MESKHWSQEQLIERIYGLTPADAHLRQCAVCEQRLEEMQRRRRDSLDDPFTDGFLAVQRREWRRRADAHAAHALWGGLSWRAVAAFAALVVLCVGLINRPVHVQHTPLATNNISDQKLFEDAFQRASGDAASSFAPIENLFEVKKP